MSGWLAREFKTEVPSLDACHACLGAGSFTKVDSIHRIWNSEFFAETLDAASFPMCTTGEQVSPRIFVGS